MLVSSESSLAKLYSLLPQTCALLGGSSYPLDSEHPPSLGRKHLHWMERSIPSPDPPLPANPGRMVFQSLRQPPAWPGLLGISLSFLGEQMGNEEQL